MPCFGSFLRHPPNEVKIDLPDCLQVLERLSPMEGEDANQRLDAVMRYRRERAYMPSRCVSTIHKAKGQEYDHVVIPLCSRTPFPDTETARRLLYVALSRARRSITIFASQESPSPLLGV